MAFLPPANSPLIATFCPLTSLGKQQYNKVLLCCFPEKAQRVKCCNQLRGREVQRAATKKYIVVQIPSENCFVNYIRDYCICSTFTSYKGTCIFTEQSMELHKCSFIHKLLLKQKSKPLAPHPFSICKFNVLSYMFSDFTIIDIRVEGLLCYIYVTTS